MNRDDAITSLRGRGYTQDVAASAVTLAVNAGDGLCMLAKHMVQFLGNGEFEVGPVPWEGEGNQVLAAVPGAWPDLGEGWDVGEIMAAIRLIDAHLDANTAPAYRDQPLAGHMSRIGKAQSEAREAMEALAGATGENPRKGVCDTWEHVVEELGDTACAALLGIQHVTKDTDATWAVFLASLAKALARVPQERPFPPESGMTRQDAIGNGITG